jgi:hypothetical protein
LTFSPRRDRSDTARLLTTPSRFIRLPASNISRPSAGARYTGSRGQAPEMMNDNTCFEMPMLAAIFVIPRPYKVFVAVDAISRAPILVLV